MSLSLEDHPALEHFLRSYLHQDWQDEFSSTDAAFGHYLESEPQLVRPIQAELSTVLDSGHDEAALLDLIRAAGSYYLPDAWGITARSWLLGLLALCPDH